MLDPNHFSATSSDAIGPAKGSQYGSAVNMQYVLSVKVEDKKYNLKFNDWFYRVDDEVVVNKSTFSKYGLHLGEVIIMFRKQVQ